LRLYVDASDRRTFLAACAVSICLNIGWGAALTIIPIRVFELGASPIEINLTYSVFATLMAVFSPIWGYSSDKVKRRKIFIMFGMYLAAPLFILVALSGGALSIIFARGSTGIFYAAVVPVSTALISDISSKETVGRNLGLFGSIGMVGMALGQLISGAIVDYFGFMSLWFLTAALYALGASIFLLYGSDPKELKGRTRGAAVEKEALGAELMIFFVIYMIFIIGLSFVGANLGVYFTRDIGLSTTFYGILVAIPTVTSISLQPMVGSLSDKYGRKPFMLLSLACMIMGYILLVISTNIVLVAIAQALFGVSTGTFLTVGSAYISDQTSPRNRSRAMGLYSSFGSAGWASGPLLGGVFIEFTSIRSAIAFSAFFPLLCIPLTVYLKRSR